MAVLNIAAIKFLFSGGGVYFQNWCRIKSHLRVNVFQTNINTPKLQIFPACQRDKPPFLEVWNTTRFRKRENFEFLLVTTLYDLFVSNWLDEFHEKFWRNYPEKIGKWRGPRASFNGNNLVFCQINVLKHQFLAWPWLLAAHHGYHSF